MARVRIEDIVDHLDSEFSRALASAVRSVVSGLIGPFFGF